MRVILGEILIDRVNLSITLGILAIIKKFSNI